MRLPDEVREALATQIAVAADREEWVHRSDSDKALLYSAWAKDSAIGAVLTGYMRPNEVHRYLKDTLIKNYVIQKMADPSVALSILGLPPQPQVSKKWIKPHGVTLTDGRIVAWSAAQEWKTTILAVYERARSGKSLQPYAAVLFNAVGKFADSNLQSLANEVAGRLGLNRTLWVP